MTARRIWHAWQTVSTGVTRSQCLALKAAPVGGGTAFLQQECEDGMADVSHIRAIFLQQLCSSSVILRPGVMQAAIGCPRSTSISAAATNLALLINTLILLR